MHELYVHDRGKVQFVLTPGSAPSPDTIAGVYDLMDHCLCGPSCIGRLSAYPGMSIEMATIFSEMPHGITFAHRPRAMLTCLASELVFFASDKGISCPLAIIENVHEIDPMARHRHRHRRDPRIHGGLWHSSTQPGIPAT